MLAEAVVSTVMHSPWPGVKPSFGNTVGSDKTHSFLYRFEIRESNNATSSTYSQKTLVVVS